jgi:hypothetical protein
MNTITIRKKNNHYVSYEVSGHVEFSEYGTDIVCAGISALAQTTLNALNIVAGIDNLIFEVEDDGYLYCELPMGLDEMQIVKSDTIINTFEIGIRSFVEVYSNNINLLIEEVESDAN